MLLHLLIHNVFICSESLSQIIYSDVSHKSVRLLMMGFKWIMPMFLRGGEPNWSVGT